MSQNCKHSLTDAVKTEHCIANSLYKYNSHQLLTVITASPLHCVHTEQQCTVVYSSPTQAIQLQTALSFIYNIFSDINTMRPYFIYITVIHW